MKTLSRRRDPPVALLGRSHLPARMPPETRVRVVDAFMP